MLTDIDFWRPIGALLFSVAFSVEAFAQPAGGAVEIPRAYSDDVTAPVIDAALELKGAALLQALRAGGYILFMRHAQASDPKPACPDELC